MARVNVHRVAQRKKPVRKGGAVVRGKGPPSQGLKFPIPDKAHARNALARINQAKPPLTSSEKGAVRRRARAVLGHSTPSMRTVR